MKILTLDGGGVFGCLQAAVLERVDAFAKFDCFVGTSIGSAICAAIASGRQVNVTPSFFHRWMPLIFKSSLRRFNPFDSKYSDAELNSALRDIFGGIFMGDTKKPLFITAVNVGSCRLKVFDAKSDGGWLLWDVVRCATAAETYFRSWKGYADGGIFVNNPSMVAVAAAARVLGCKIEDMEVLSIGTGDRTCSGSRGPIALWSWGLWLLKAQLDGASDKMHDYFLRSLPVRKYERIQFATKSDWKMDSPSAMLEAERLLKSEIDHAVKIVKEF